MGTTTGKDLERQSRNLITPTSLKWVTKLRTVIFLKVKKSTLYIDPLHELVILIFDLIKVRQFEEFARRPV